MNNRNNNYLVHHGVKGMHWYERQYQYKDGSLTPLGRIHYDVGPPRKKGSESPSSSRRSTRIGGGTPVNRRKVRIGGSASESEKAQAELLKQQAKLEKAKRKEYERKQKEKRKAKEEEEKKLREAEKKEKERQDILKSGDVDKILSNRDKFTNEELQSALKNIRTDRKTLEDFYELENKYKTTKLDRKEIDRRLKEDKEKEEILKSGDPAKLLENQEKFTIEELTSAMNRVKTKAGIDDLRREIEKRERQNKVDKFLSNTEYIADLTLKGASVYEKIKEGKDRLFAARSNWDSLSLNDQLEQLGKGGVNSIQLNSLLNKANTIKALTSAVKGIRDTINNADDNSDRSKKINEMTLPELTMAFAKGNLNDEDTAALNKRASEWGRLYESLSKMRNATGRSFDIESTKEYKDLEADLKRKTKDIQEIVNNAGTKSNNSQSSTPNLESLLTPNTNNTASEPKKKSLLGRKNKGADNRSEFEKFQDEMAALDSTIGDTSSQFTPSSRRESGSSSRQETTTESGSSTSRREPNKKDGDSIINSLTKAGQNEAKAELKKEKAEREESAKAAKAERQESLEAERQESLEAERQAANKEAVYIHGTKYGFSNKYSAEYFESTAKLLKNASPKELNALATAARNMEEPLRKWDEQQTRTIQNALDQLDNFTDTMSTPMANTRDVSDVEELKLRNFD